MATTQPQVSWLHISDFHLKADAPYDQDVVLGSLVSSLPKLYERFGRPDFIVASGDIGQSGRAHEYERATKLFDDILAGCGLGRERLFIVPGNHDIDRRNGVGLARTLTNPSDCDSYFLPSSDLIHTSHRQKDFKSWYDNYFERIRKFPSNSSYSIESLNISGNNIGVCLFNTSVFSIDDADFGKLLIGRRCVDSAIQDLQALSTVFNIAVLHHPFSWISQVESSHVKSAIQAAFDCVLTGHLHDNEIEHIVGSSGSTIHLAAGASYQGSEWPNMALLCGIFDAELRISPIKFSNLPRPRWSLDTALFPDHATYQGIFALKALAISRSESPITAADISKGLNLDALNSEKTAAIRLRIEDGLLTTPSGEVVYATPRLMPRSQVAALDSVDQDAFSLEQIAASEESFVIETRPEYGASTLCHLIEYAVALEGKSVFVRNARELPNYRKKLEAEFHAEIASQGKFTLIIDDVDIERDERLLSELSVSGWLDRIIIICVNRRLIEGLIDIATVPFKPRHLFLWAMGREEIRNFAHVILEPNDHFSESRAVDKVYSDLLSLRIPLTPSNVAMYLRVLQREGDFEPLSRVDILSRYLAESLRKPSDVSSDSFNFKNKMDILSAFAFDLHKKETGSFDDREWLNFCDEHQKRTLSEFNAKIFLAELRESRIFSTYKGRMYFKYSFYYTFFLGRYLSSRSNEVRSLFSSPQYLMHFSLVDVITGLSSENSEIIALLTEKLEGHLTEFETKYVKPDFDPLIGAIWPSNDKEEEQLWKPVQAAIAAGPADNKRIDELKTSMLAEARTVNQQVTFEKFSELENALFAEAFMLGDALKNADDVDGEIKVRAWHSVLRATLVVLQVGTMFAPTLAKRKRFGWGGIEFVDFNQISEGGDISNEVVLSVVCCLAEAVASKTSQDYGSVKLAPVFRSMSSSGILKGAVELTNFACIATARGRGWSATLTSIIEQTDKNAYYLSQMLDQLLHLLEFEIMTGHDREDMKRLVALIQAKRNWSKQMPGSKAIGRMQEALEKDAYFPEGKDLG